MDLEQGDQDDNVIKYIKTYGESQIYKFETHEKHLERIETKKK